VSDGSDIIASTFLGDLVSKMIFLNLRLGEGNLVNCWNNLGMAH
jgi:hypothetical protein